MVLVHNLVDLRKMGHDVIQVTGLSTVLVIMMLLLSLELDILEVCASRDNW